MAVQAARAFLYDTFFTSAAALDHEIGSSESAIDESAVKRAFSQNSQRVILAVDHSKLGTRAQARLFDIEDIDLLITDLDPSDERLDPYRNRVGIA